MRSICALVVLLSLAVAQSAAADGGDGKRLQLKVIKHQPCTAKPTASEIIRFSAGSEASLRKDKLRGDGCYYVDGPVVVRKLMRGNVHAYVEARYGSKAPLEECRGADASKCGGVGSCVYCDVCSAAEAGKTKASRFIQATRNGKLLDCEKGVGAGSYSDLRLSFCMPTKYEFLKAQNMDEEFWDKYAADD